MAVFGSAKLATTCKDNPPSIACHPGPCLINLCISHLSALQRGVVYTLPRFYATEGDNRWRFSRPWMERMWHWMSARSATARPSEPQTAFSKPGSSATPRPPYEA